MNILRFAAFTVLSGVVVFLITVFFRLGGHKPVFIERKANLSMWILYQEVRGPYHQVNDHIVQVEQFARDNKISCESTFGYFLDDAQTVDETRLRSWVGCLLNPTDSVLGTKSVPTNDKKIQIGEIKFNDYVFANFKGAPSIGPFKVYSKVNQWMHEQGVMPKQKNVAIEVYKIQDSNSAETDYYFPLDSRP